MTVNRSSDSIFSNPYFKTCLLILSIFSFWIVWEENKQQPKSSCPNVSRSQGPGEQGKVATLTGPCDLVATGAR